MEHDEECEREGTARGIAAVKRVRLSREEFNHLTSDVMVHGIACRCADRAECKFPRLLPKSELRHRAINYILDRRSGKLEVSEPAAPWKMSKVVANPNARKAGKVEREGNVIRVDFRNRGG